MQDSMVMAVLDEYEAPRRARPSISFAQPMYFQLLTEEPTAGLAAQEGMMMLQEAYKDDNDDEE